MDRPFDVQGWAVFLLLLCLAAVASAAPPAPRPLDVKGVVQTPDGKPAGNATVTVGLVDVEAHKIVVSGSVQTDSTGAFALHVDTDPSYIGRQAYSFLYAESPTGVAVVYQWHSSKPLILEPFTSVRLQFVDESGAPIAHLRVAPRSFELGQAFGWWDEGVDARWTGVTDDKGFVTLSQLPQRITMVLDVDDDRFARLDGTGQVSLADSAETPTQTVRVAPGGIITGKAFFGASGQPAAHVCVKARENSGGYGSSETGPDGAYRIARLQPGDYTLQASIEQPGDSGWTAPALSAVVSTGATSANIDFSFVHGALLIGTIRDKATGAPRPDVEIVAAGPGGQDDAFSGQDGTYRLRVPAGDQRVMAYVQGSGNADPRQNVHVGDGETKSLDFFVSPPPARHSVHGTVLGPDGGKIAGARVIAVDVGSDIRTEITDSRGGFVFDQPGVTSAARLYARSGDLATVSGGVALGNGPAVLHLAGVLLCGIQGVVRDSYGAAVSNATVTLNCEVYSLGSGGPKTCQTNANGHYFFGGQYADTKYMVGAELPGYSSGYSGEITLAVGKTIVAPTLTITQADSFAGGTVRDPEGNPVAGAVVRDPETPNAASATSDANGRFHLTGVTRGQAILQVDAPENRSASVQVTSGTDSNQVVVRTQGEMDDERRKFVDRVKADPSRHGDGTDARVLLASAEKSAAAGGKRIFIDFYASWCGPCFMLHRFLKDPQAKPIIDSYFVVQPIDVWEHSTNGWENPGGTDLYKKYSPYQGVPYFAILDATGRKLGDSVYNGQNMGMPSLPEEIAFFLKTLKAAAPAMTDGEMTKLKAAIARAVAL